MMKPFKSPHINQPDSGALRERLESVLNQYDRVSAAMKAGLKSTPSRHHHKAAERIEDLDSTLDRVVTDIEMALQKGRIHSPDMTKKLRTTCVKSGGRIRKIRHGFEFDALPCFDDLIAELLRFNRALEELETVLDSWLITLGRSLERDNDSLVESVSPYQVAA